MTLNDLISRKTSLPKAFKWQQHAPSGDWYGIIEDNALDMKWLSEKLGDAEVSVISEGVNHCGTHYVITFKVVNR